MCACIKFIMADKRIIDFDNLFLECFLKPDVGKSNHFLFNTENSMAVFEKIKKRIFTFEEELYSYSPEKSATKTLITYKIKSTNPTSHYTDMNYKTCLLTGNAFEETLVLNISIIKEVRKEKDKYEISSSDVVHNNVIEIKIPLYIGSGAKTTNGLNPYPEPLETGGFFVLKNSKKHVVFKFDRTCNSLRYALEKNIHHGSFSSNPIRYSEPFTKPQFITLDIDISPGKVDAIVKSEKTLPAMNIIYLILYLTRLPLSQIKEMLLSRFVCGDVIYDHKITDIIEILFSGIEEDIRKNEQREDKDKRDQLSLVTEYITKQFKIFFDANKEFTDENSSYKIFNSFLLPAVNSLLNSRNKKKLPMVNTRVMIKGMTLYYQLENMIIAAFQNSIYPDKYNLCNRRIASPGTTFESISIDIVKTLINEYTSQITSGLKLNTGNVNFKAVRKVQNVFGTVFNMQDKKHSGVIKPDKSHNFAQRYILNNLVVSDSSIRLTKFLNSRDPDLSTWAYMGPVDTPDHGENVGINRRINVGTIINDKDFDTHEELNNGVITIVNNFIKKYKNDFKIGKDMINIILVDDSEIWLGALPQDDGIKLYKKLKEVKRSKLMKTNLIDISLIPYYTYSSLKTFLPIKKYRSIRIHTGNKVMFFPFYIVEDGELLLSKVKFNESLDELRRMSFDLITNKYIFCEFLGPDELLYSNVCDSISSFYKLTPEERKLYQYVAFDNSLNLGILESMIFEIGKMPGTRGTFSSSQLKNSVSSIQPDSLNVIDAVKYSIAGFQEPCITNNILLESRIPKQSFGTHVIMAFMSYNNNIEDSLIVSKEAVRNGMFAVINTQLYKGSTGLKNVHSEMANLKNFKNSYAKLDNDMVPRENSVLEPGDALYGEVEHKVNMSNNVFYVQDTSTAYKFLIPGRVDRIFLTNNDSKMDIKYTVNACHFLERGHKMSNQCAQKGTVSLIAESWEIPYNINGVQPDIILNTLSIIGRKTINIYYQTLITNFYNYVPFGPDGKKRYIKVKSFSDMDYDSFLKHEEEMIKHYPSYSKNEIQKMFQNCETLIDPSTGHVLKHDVFMGPIYINRLTQISDEKISVYNRGRLNKLNQPPSGKQRGGSHRLGEMEVDVLATHGATEILYEISKDSAEVQSCVNICQTCMNVAVEFSDGSQNILSCLNCENLGLTPVFQTHNISKVSKMLIGLLGFRGVKVDIKYNPVKPLYYSKMV